MDDHQYQMLQDKHEDQDRVSVSLTNNGVFCEIHFLESGGIEDYK